MKEKYEYYLKGLFFVTLIFIIFQIYLAPNIYYRLKDLRGNIVSFSIFGDIDKITVSIVVINILFQWFLLLTFFSLIIAFLKKLKFKLFACLLCLMFLFLGFWFFVGPIFNSYTIE